MERTFEDLANILSTPRRHFLAESLATGLAIGVGIAVVRALAG
ncbi:hypothetical protein [Mesorhizobium sp.]|nr:hypothetical protein [Mesorhizobium sp.]